MLEMVSHLPNGVIVPPCPPVIPHVAMDVPEPPYSAPPVVITKAPSAPIAPVGYSSALVPGLMDTLMMPAAVSLPTHDPDPPPMVHVVYVGGLYSGTSSDFVINIMQKCGKLVNFKRHTDPSSGLLANFALCEFETPRGAYYALECLANLKFGDGEIKVSCNDKVRRLVDAWVKEQMASLREQHGDLNDAELEQLFRAPESDLREELENLIKYEVMAMQESSSSVGSQPGVSKPDTSRVLRKVSSIRSDASAGTESESVTSKEYVVHSKETQRRNKLKSRQRSDDELFRKEEHAWLREEEDLLRKLHRIGTVKRSTRERLIRADIEGYARSTDAKERELERQMDLEDAKAESMELYAAEPRCTIPIAPATVAQPVVEVPKTVPTVFSATAEEDEPMFNRTYRPKIKLGIPDSEIWSRVPKEADAVFGYAIDWDIVLGDKSLMALIEPWMRKCIMEYMGGDESVVGEVLDFIAGRLLERPEPADLLSDVEQFLDEDSRGFVIELWRHLIFHQIRQKD
uniref:PWI domain containing protein n=1 Tax=Babesia bovis TaxID=5865 RepID=A7AT83_BABBO|eukprot:XP_001609712.1 hypothetical protein [Babesia bovis T2Bo]